MTAVANQLDAKQAIEAAKKEVQSLFSDEGLVNLGLEEVVPSDHNSWMITLGFSRPWNNANNAISAALSNPRRTYKVVHINSSGAVVSVKNRD